MKKQLWIPQSECATQRTISDVEEKDNSLAQQSQGIVVLR